MKTNLLSKIQSNAGYTVRTEMHQNKKHLVVPVVMMVEGVHSGSHGPLLHLAEDLGKFPEAWNGIPVVIEHPQDNGKNVSANSPQVIDREIVGRVYNTYMDGDKLKAEVWLEEDRMLLGRNTALAYIKEQKPLDVSVGVFTEEEEVTGQWKGETYESIARNHRPDHLALLPGGTGACSWSDGCGIRLNKKGGKNVSKEKQKEELITTMKSLIAEGLSVFPIETNEQGFREITNSIQSKLDAMDDDVKVHYLQEVYDDHFIYRVGRREGLETLYKRTYTVNEDESIEFTGEPIEVRRKVDYVVMAAAGLRRTNFNNNQIKEVKQMAEKGKPCCPDKVNDLIANKLSRYTEEDREWLLTQDGDTLEKMFPMEPKKEDPPQVNEVDAVQVLKEKLSKPEDFIAIMPKEMQDSMNAGLKAYSAQKAKMIKTILDNTENVWTEDELKAMNSDTLQKVYGTVKEPEDYSGQGAGEGKGPINTNAEEILVPTGIELKTKE